MMFLFVIGTFIAGVLLLITILGSRYLSRKAFGYRNYSFLALHGLFLSLVCLWRFLAVWNLNSESGVGLIGISFILPFVLAFYTSSLVNILLDLRHRKGLAAGLCFLLLALFILMWYQQLLISCLLALIIGVWAQIVIIRDGKKLLDQSRRRIDTNRRF